MPTRRAKDRPLISRRSFLRNTGMAVLASGLYPLLREARAEQSKRPPNVVLILADDLGWRDTSLYGSTFYETPNIDALAKRGMMFTNAYTANPLCSPTRASIMTGLHPARIGITSAVCHLEEVRLEAGLAERGSPQAKALSAASVTRLKPEYLTLAEALEAAGYATAHFGKWHLGREPYDPLHQGFEVDIPHLPGFAGPPAYLGPWNAWPGGEPGEHIEDRMSSEAVKFIKANKDRPFFVNFWCWSVHSPLDGKDELIEKYKAKAGLENPQRCPVMGAMIQSLDEAVGTIIKALDEEGLSDNTIVIFTSDNGGVSWGRCMGAPVTSNAPLRGGKAELYEGGTRVPLVVVWPRRVRPGKTSDSLVQSIDFYPTVLEMCGLRPKSDQRFDGTSIVPALVGTGSLRNRALFCHFPHEIPASGNHPGTWVRKSNWKLIRFYCDSPDRTDRFELYNLKDDIGETKNLADKMPDKVKKLNALIDQFLKDTGAAAPKPNPAYDPDAKPKDGGMEFPDPTQAGRREG